MGQLPELIAYELFPNTGVELVPSSPSQEWMATTKGKAAHVCLPIRMANQAGWTVLNQVATQMLWDGRGVHIRDEHSPDVVVSFGPDTPPVTQRPPSIPPTGMRACNHFVGDGIVTWNIPYLFRTSPGYNLLVRGPANVIKDGIAPLEALVETDWNPVPFTMNWKFTRPHVWVSMAVGEPLCQLVPQRRGELESFTTRIRPMDSDADIRRSFDEFEAARVQWNTERSENQWLRQYTKNQMPGGASGQGHQTRLRLCPFSSDQSEDVAP